MRDGDFERVGGKRVLRKALRALRAGGRILVSDVWLESTGTVPPFISAEIAPEEVDHFRVDRFRMCVVGLVVAVLNQMQESWLAGGGIEVVGIVRRHDGVLLAVENKEGRGASLATTRRGTISSGWAWKCVARPPEAELHDRRQHAEVEAAPRGDCAVQRRVGRVRDDRSNTWLLRGCKDRGGASIENPRAPIRSPKHSGRDVTYCTAPITSCASRKPPVARWPSLSPTARKSKSNTWKPPSQSDSDHSSICSRVWDIPGQQRTTPAAGWVFAGTNQPASSAPSPAEGNRTSVPPASRTLRGICGATRFG